MLASLWPGGLAEGCAAAPSLGSGWLSAANLDGGTGLVFADASSGRITRIATDFRGHSVSANPLRPWEVVLFARRPGRVAAVIDLLQERVVRTFEASAQRSFQGHGFFTPDASRLVTVEADAHTAQGWLGLRDAETFELVGEVETGGIGPHEAKLMPDGDTVVVANGGLLTRSETGRAVLNLETMDSSLVYASLESGALLETHRVEVPKGSIRHLDVTRDGTVALGLQVQREAVGHERELPLAGVHRRGEPVVLFDDDLDTVRALNDYVGSVAISATTRVVGMTSPRGNLALFWDIDGGAYRGLHQLVDCSGIAARGSHFVLSSSTGEVRTLRADDLEEVRASRVRYDDVRWDNHLSASIAETTS